MKFRITLSYLTVLSILFASILGCASSENTSPVEDEKPTESSIPVTPPVAREQPVSPLVDQFPDRTVGTQKVTKGAIEKPSDNNDTGSEMSETVRIHVKKWSLQKMSSFSTLAFQKEGVIVKIVGTHILRHDENESYSGYSGLIESTLFHKDTRKKLMDVRHFIKEGGRAVLLLCGDCSEYNGELQEVFSASIIRKRLLYIPGDSEDPNRAGKSPIIKGDNYCALFNGLLISGGAAISASLKKNKDGKWETTRWRCSELDCYLVPVGNQWVSTYFVVEDQRYCLSAWRKLGKGELLLLASFHRYDYPESFFIDKNIDAGNNSEAALRLVRWLAGKAEFPLFVSGGEKM